MKKVLLFIFFTMLILSFNSTVYADSVMIKDRSVTVTLDKEENILKVDETITTGSVIKDSDVKFKKSGFSKDVVFDTNLPNFVAVLDNTTSSYTIEFDLESNSTYQFAYLYPCEGKECKYVYSGLIDGKHNIVQNSKIFVVSKDESDISVCTYSVTSNYSIKKEKNNAELNIYSDPYILSVYIYKDGNTKCIDPTTINPNKTNPLITLDSLFEYNLVIAILICNFCMIIILLERTKRIDDETLENNDNYKLLKRWYDFKIGNLEENTVKIVTISILFIVSICGFLYTNTHSTLLDNIYGKKFFDLGNTINISLIVIFIIELIILGIVYCRYKKNKLKHEICNGKLYFVRDYSCTRKYNGTSNILRLTIKAKIKDENGIEHEYINSHIEVQDEKFHDRKVFVLVISPYKNYLDILR